MLYTHEHADHVAGIDDLRVFSERERRDIPVYGPAAALESLRTSHRYIFDESVTVLPGTSKPRLSLHPLTPGAPTTVAGFDLLPLAFPHGTGEVFGYRSGDAAYLTDVKSVPPTARARLRGLELLVINALWWRAHPTHLSIDEAIAVAEDLGAVRTILTHLTHETGHADLAARLPRGIEPGYDGLTVELR